MILFNKKGFAKIKCSKKTKDIHEGFSTQLTANFTHLIGGKNAILPVWIIECDNIGSYDIKESEDGMILYLSTSYDHTGDVVNVILTDIENNYESDSIRLEVIGH